MKKNNKDWEKELTPEQYAVMCNRSTEQPYSGKYLYNNQKGMYECARCGKPLFSSDTKFESDMGWPAFYDTVSKDNIELKEDDRYGMIRTEVTCKNCGAHLGHLFDDGPKEHNGTHYCINSAALNFKKK